MRRRLPQGTWLVAVALLAAACGGGVATPAPATPTPKPAALKPDSAAALAGHWIWSAEVGGEAYAGTMDLTRGTDGAWQAKVADNTMGELPVTGVKVEGTTVTVNVTADGNPASVVATLQADGTVVGRVLVGGGEGTFQARKG